MIDIVKVVNVEPVGGFRLKVRFSNGQGGIADFSNMVAEGGAMVTPLAQPGFFKRVFLQNGVLAWPNGFDIDAIALHDEMQEANLLSAAATAAE
jgi:hypothetical protein